MSSTISTTVEERLAQSEQGASSANCCRQGCRFFAAETGSVPSGTDRNWAIQTFARNETIYTKGSKSTFTFRVLEGAVRLTRVFADGRRQIVNFYLPDEIFGFEFSETYTSTAEAVGEVVTMRCPRACVLYHSATDPDINLRRLAMLGKSLNAAEKHVTMLGHQSARQRVASFFLTFEKVRGKDDSFMLDLPLGRQDIADYLGLTIETTCRALSDLKRRQIIDTPRRRQIVVRDPGCLKAIAEGLAA
ncbi:MAG: helix-turn-helix domain-containing protein [Rhizomicrobium sp.]